MKTIHADKAPKALGPYSHAQIVGDHVIFLSGQTPIDPATGKLVPGGIAEQTAQVCKNLGAVLEAAGSDLEHVLKTTCFLADMADFAAFNEVYGKYFTGKPARSTFAVKALPMGALVEVEAVGEVK
jgi:2-iminobutanoate/2-iminopropanoate deaminase